MWLKLWIKAAFFVVRRKKGTMKLAVNWCGLRSRLLDSNGEKVLLYIGKARTKCSLQCQGGGLLGSSVES